MSFKQINNVWIRGISACVPSFIESNADLAILGDLKEAEKYIESTGVRQRHLVKDSGICTSDLCFEAAVKLIKDLNWSPGDIDCLIFVSQTHDYILPATSCILQDRLGLNNECFCLDISLGCSGWVYGLSVISSLMADGVMKRGLLLVGDTTSVTKSSKDKSTYPLFGDAGTASAIEFSNESNRMVFNFGTDGKGFKAIMIPEGGFRNFYNSGSLVEKEAEPGIFRNNLHSILDGPAVFSFGISKAPKSVNSLLGEYGISKHEIDFFVFHQANLFMNEKIRSKLKIEPEKVPYSLDMYGNTSSASIPLTIASQLSSQLNSGSHRILTCAFGVGLSWASAVFDVKDLYCPAVIEI